VQGYHIIFSEVIDFSHFGVPQSRERLIIVGVRKDLLKTLNELWKIKSAFTRKLRESAGLFPKYPLTAIEVFEGKRLDELDAKYKEVMEKWNGIWLEVNTENAWEWKREVWDTLTFSIIEDYLVVNKIKSTNREELEEALKEHDGVLRELGYYGVPITSINPPDGTNAPPEDDPAVVERMKRIPPDENHEFVRGTKWEVEGRGISLVYRRLHPLKPSYTIVAYGGGGTHGYHYDRDRSARRHGS
jgi:DNA (cytosine-5)-methyltransferase 1